MRRGQTIVAEREYVESDSERMLARKKQRRKSVMSVLLVLLLLATLAALGYMGVKSLAERQEQVETTELTQEYKVRAEVVDEAGRGQVSTRTYQYIAMMEEDLGDLGYTMTRATLPLNMIREIYVDIAEVDGYFKVNLDRDAAVSAEDAVRMLKYLKERGIKAEYVDVRIEGKAYYKEAIEEKKPEEKEPEA